MFASNVKAMAAHAIISLLVLFIARRASMISITFQIITIGFAWLFYIAFGFFVLYSANNRLLSVSSVFLILLIVFIYCLFRGGGDFLIYYGYFNTVCMVPFSWFGNVGLFISTAIPSLLMYLGMFLRTMYNTKI